MLQAAALRPAFGRSPVVRRAQSRRLQLAWLAAGGGLLAIGRPVMRPSICRLVVPPARGSGGPIGHSIPA